MTAPSVHTLSHTYATKSLLVTMGHPQNRHTDTQTDRWSRRETCTKSAYGQTDSDALKTIQTQVMTRKNKEVGNIHHTSLEYWTSTVQIVSNKSEIIV